MKSKPVVSIYDYSGLTIVQGKNGKPIFIPKGQVRGFIRGIEKAIKAAKK